MLSSLPACWPPPVLQAVLDALGEEGGQLPPIAYLPPPRLDVSGSSGGGGEAARLLNEAEVEAAFERAVLDQQALDIEVGGWMAGLGCRPGGRRALATRNGASQVGRHCITAALHEFPASLLLVSGPSAVQATPSQHMGSQRGGMLEQLLGALDLQPSLPQVCGRWIHAAAALGVVACAADSDS